MQARLLLPAAALALPLACNDASTGDDGFDFSTDSAATAGTAASGSTAAEPGDTTEASTGAVDSGSGSEGSESSTGAPPPAVPCTGIDLLFVVDDSEPMSEEQMRLRMAAPAFVQQVTAAIPTLAEGINLGVITTDDELFVQGNAMPCAPYEGGNNWMLGSSTVLATELDCALDVGVAGSPDERPMEMLLGALSDEHLMPGGFHDGFLRESALLVVVLVTNEEDEYEKDTEWGSIGNPPEWVGAIAARKGGWEHDVVVLSLLGTEKPNACPDFQWDGTEGAQVSPRLIEFTQAFPQGAVGDICAADYGPFLQGVVPGIVAACADYTPP